MDRELTKLTYEGFTLGGAESCGCDDCKNFVYNREDIYPEEIKKLFDQLGIDYKKETEIGHYCRQPEGLTLDNR